MRLLGNILWHIPLLGFINAALVYVFGLLLTLTIIGSPLGIGLMEYGKFLFWPFGNAMVSKEELNIDQHPLWTAYSTIVMILYLPFGLILVIVSCIQIVGLLTSLIGIPVALVIAKSLGTFFNPVNKKCVPAEVVSVLSRQKAEAILKKS